METLKKGLSKVKWDFIITSVLMIAVGILCAVLPTDSANVLCYIFGGMLIISGTVIMTRYFMLNMMLGGYLLIVSITMVLGGIFCIVYPQAVQGILTVLFGLFIVIDSINSLSDSIVCAKAKVNSWWILFVLSLITAALGIAVMFSTFETVMIFAGVSLILEGVKNIVITITFNHKIKTAKKQVQKRIAELDDDIIDI